MTMVATSVSAPISVPPPSSCNLEQAIPEASPMLDAPARFRVAEMRAATFDVAALAETVTDLERTRIAAENRHRSWVQAGLGDTSAATQAAAIVEAIAKVEHDGTLSLQRALRKHPLGPFVKRTVGLGEKQTARLLASIGDPYWNTLHDRPRTVSELWAYSGFHVLRSGQVPPEAQLKRAGADPSAASDHLLYDAQNVAVAGGIFSHLDQSSSGTQASLVEVGPSQGSHLGQKADGNQGLVAGVAAKRQKGVRANWSNDAKMRAFLCATSCIKQMDSPYRVVYDEGRTKYADAVHGADCPQCGMCATCGKPPSANKALHAETGCPNRRVVHAVAGTPLRDGHKHARAMRLVAKAILRDLWLESKAWHQA